MMDKDIVVAIINTARILAFMGLAITFNKWWIILFAPLFMLTNAKED